MKGTYYLKARNELGVDVVLKIRFHDDNIEEGIELSPEEAEEEVKQAQYEEEHH